MIEIKIIDSAHKQDINLPNEPFQLWGRMIPSYENETWHYTVTEYAPQDISEMCFPDEDYDYDGLFKDHVFVGAYDGDRCIGVAILVDDWFKYMYLDDLKVCRSYRKQGVGKALLQAALDRYANVLDVDDRASVADGAEELRVLEDEIEATAAQ